VLNYFLYDDQVIRSYDEDALRRLSWFLTLPGLVAAVAGFAVVAMSRWRAAVWLAVGPALALLAIYVHHAEIAPRLLGWTRRFVPSGLLALALLIGIACAATLAWRGLGAPLVRAAGLGVAVLVVATGLVQDRPLAGHREFDGSFAASTRIAAAAGGRQGVFVWDRGTRPRRGSRCRCGCTGASCCSRRGGAGRPGRAAPSLPGPARVRGHRPRRLAAGPARRRADQGRPLPGEYAVLGAVGHQPPGPQRRDRGRGGALVGRRLTTAPALEAGGRLICGRP
jgi:hypothetical protein